MNILVLVQKKLLRREREHHFLSAGVIVSIENTFIMYYKSNVCFFPP